MTNPSEPPGSTVALDRPISGIDLLSSNLAFSTTASPAYDWLLRDIMPAGRTSPHCRVFRRRMYPDATPAQWNDWQWQLANRITTRAALQRFLSLSPREEAAFSRCNGSLPVALTPYYASLLDEKNDHQPLRKAVIPVLNEHTAAPGEAADPLGEEEHSPVPGIVHRYPDRALFLVTSTCSTYCRYCTRSRLVGREHHGHHTRGAWEKAIAYIEKTPAIRDVLLSGGDPLTLSDEALEWLLTRLRRIPHVEIIRLGTKVPAVLPQRITLRLTRLLRRFHPLWISIHATHPDEITPEMSQACVRLADAGIPLGSQTVLLAGINDDPETMRRLMHGLLKIRVRPYYLYQCDPIIGSSHFRTPVAKGIEIIQSLRGWTSGYAVPTFVIDAPGGGGKIPITPEYVEGCKHGDMVLRNYQGNLYRYPDHAAAGVETAGR
jgi:lysine 2,3-aminomutase